MLLGGTGSRWDGGRGRISAKMVVSRGSSSRIMGAGCIALCSFGGLLVPELRSIRPSIHAGSFCTHVDAKRCGWKKSFLSGLITDSEENKEIDFSLTNQMRCSANPSC